MDARKFSNYLGSMANHGVVPARPIRVPFLDLGPTHSGLKAEILTEISALIDSGAFSNGRHVGAFEAEFARYCGRSHCVGVGSGLDALRLALLGAQIEEGDEVIVPAHTFVATFEAVTQAGGMPVPVDVDERDYTLDVVAAEDRICRRTRFLLPVHLYGQMADMRSLRTISKRHDLEIIEDACQAHGAERDGVRAGAIGLGAAFSFYPTKNLGAMGDAGAVVTNDIQLVSRVRALREHGQLVKARHDLEGYTTRLDTIQALVLLRKLPLLDKWNADRRALALLYTNALEGIGDLRLPPVPPGSRPVWHVYVIRTQRPEALSAFLAERGIGTGRHYAEAPHLSGAYARLGYRRGCFSVAEALASECLSLPIFPGMTEGQIDLVVEGIGAYFSDGYQPG